MRSFQSINLLFVLIFFSHSIIAQKYTLDLSGSEMVINGTSTLHDWHTEVLNFEGSAMIEAGDESISDIEELSMTFFVGSMKSGKRAMDNNTYEALKRSDFPEITYRLTRVDEINEDQINGFGLLTIAGTTREVEMSVNYDFQGARVIEFSGDLSLKMTDFKIDPPTALLGTVKTGDEVTVSYKVHFKQ